MDVITAEPVKETIAVTGKFPQRQHVLQALIEQHPTLHYSLNVTRACTCLISTQPVDEDSVKVRQARQYGVPVHDIAYLAQLLGLGTI